jgi:hypothetical protein
MDARLSTYLLRSASLPFLKQWLRLFPRKQLLILHNHEMRRDTSAALTQVCNFLDLPPFRPASIKPVNEALYPTMPAAVKERLETWFRPHQLALGDFLVSVTGNE